MNINEDTIERLNYSNNGNLTEEQIILGITTLIPEFSFQKIYPRFSRSMKIF